MHIYMYMYICIYIHIRLNDCQYYVEGVLEVFMVLEPFGEHGGPDNR